MRLYLPCLITILARHAAGYRVPECGVTRRGLFSGAAAFSGAAVATAALPALAGKDADTETVLAAKPELSVSEHPRPRVRPCL